MAYHELVGAVLSEVVCHCRLVEYFKQYEIVLPE